jgi:hypothetical protein
VRALRQYRTPLTNLKMRATRGKLTTFPNGMSLKYSDCTRSLMWLQMEQCFRWCDSSSSCACVKITFFARIWPYDSAKKRSIGPASLPSNSFVALSQRRILTVHRFFGGLKEWSFSLHAIATTRMSRSRDSVYWETGRMDSNQLKPENQLSNKSQLTTK